MVPSLPGYFLSTLPRRDGFGPYDIAKLFNGLMTDVLGYPRYAAQGGDMVSLFSFKFVQKLFYIFSLGISFSSSHG